MSKKDNYKVCTSNDLQNQLTNLSQLTYGSRHIMIPKNINVLQNDIDNQGIKIASPQFTGKNMDTLISIAENAQEANDFESSESILNLSTDYLSQSKRDQEDRNLTEKNDHRAALFIGFILK